MLTGIDPLLTGDLLKVLSDLGHGEEIAVVDANFTAGLLAGPRPLIRLAGAGLVRSCEAILSVFPLDVDVPSPVSYMQVGGTPPGHLSPVQQSVIDLVARLGGRDRQACEALDRFAFYEKVRGASAIIQTGELAPFANFTFAKAVVHVVQ